MSCADSSCKNCNGVCDTEQSLCTINSQMATSYGGGFNWPSNPAIDVPIVKVWTAAAWNQLKAAIDAAYAAGSECSSQGEDFGANTMPTVSQNQPITADIYNKAINAINKLQGGHPTVNKEDIIRAYHAANMSNGYNGGQISPLACDECNVDCDVTCDGCIGCVDCQGMLHYSTCYGSCYGSCN